VAPVKLSGREKGAVQLRKECVDIKIVKVGAMFNGFDISKLAFITVKLVLYEDTYCFRMLSDDITDDHIFGDHSG
jgi:hypothetical protein